ncbi:uncharacterized membrane protein [Hahella chejuensis KCTC 2396]|uniref:Uncharacterized membrane protein n=1 Tax=Hahella chejuensis (strain KCTC 2396) TaxID=349521 RepID=Q2S989_HAHCH|nr:rhombosortase [Hahella chejuensis]ABC32785.1 uncharacterized membrane protein [Hahella chejuensis KCTC 2396]
MSNRVSLSLTLNKIGLLFAALLVLMQVISHWYGYLLNFNRPEIMSGDYWRLISGHFVHLSWVHLALNAVAAYLIYDSFDHNFKNWRFPLYLGLLSLLISIGLLLFYKTTRTYVGLSGVLHGLLVLGVLAGGRFPRWVLIALFVGVTAKIIWEQTPYYDEGQIARLIGGPVAEQAHLLGYFSGLIIAVVVRFLGKFR